MGLAPFVIVSVASSVVLTEGIYDMLAEQFLKKREARGKAKGAAENQRKWEAWNKRRIQAVEAGEEFNEPPPTISKNGTD